MFDTELGQRNPKLFYPKNVDQNEFEEITSDGLKSPGRTVGEFFKNSPNIPRPKGSNPSLK